MTKISIKNQKITPFGGIFIYEDICKELGLKELIDSTLGQRGKVGKAYPYSEVITTLHKSILCGGTCIEDVNTLAAHFDLRAGNHTPGADTIGRGLKELAVENTEYSCEKSRKTYAFNTADKLNLLLLKIVRHLKLVTPGESVVLDFDHQFLPTDKHDAKYSYKGANGYFPGNATIGGVFVGCENRDGNANVKFCQAETLRRILTRVRQELGVTIGKFRADCGSYSAEIIGEVEKHCDTFYIRAANCADRCDRFRNSDGWAPVEIDNVPCEVKSFEDSDLIEGKTYRLVVQRTPKRDSDGKVVTGIYGTEYVYRAIITNDWDMGDKDVILFYNQRGASERNFDVLNNDFCWSHLPFSFLDQNTVFLLVTAMLKNIFLYLTTRLSKVIPALRATSRLKKLMLHFICVPAKWIRRGRRQILNLYTDRRYYADILLE